MSSRSCGLSFKSGVILTKTPETIANTARRSPGITVNQRAALESGRFLAPIRAVISGSTNNPAVIAASMLVLLIVSPVVE
jgi:hypothetical protein